MVIAPDLASALAEIEDNRARRQADLDAECQRIEDLKTYAGVKGTNDESRKLDRHEFAENNAGTEHAGGAADELVGNQGNRYRREVLPLMSTIMSSRACRLTTASRCASAP